jgi:2-polyprenyl-3-methyl-5-hydroxy-6-metoxy-1,4-benzoquinol methylase
MISRKAAGDWTPEHVQRLWTYWNSKAHLQADNFAFQVGTGIINFLASTGRLKGAALDYGCGLGFLTERLLSRGLECYAAEFSPESVELVNRKFQSYSNWKGAQLVRELPTPFEAGSFDVVTCTEMIEHLSDDLLSGIIREMRRLVRRGGVVLFTTPNDEDLELAMTFCPFCEAEFHKVQHVRKFTVDSLRALLESHGFEVMFCQNINFHEFQRFPGLSPASEVNWRLLREWFTGKKDRFLDRRFPREFPYARDFQRRAIPGPHLSAIVTPGV